MKQDRSCSAAQEQDTSDWESDWDDEQDEQVEQRRREEELYGPGGLYDYRDL